VTTVAPVAEGPAGPVLLYDGACSFCGAAVRRVLGRDQRGTLRFAALGSPYADRVFGRHPVLVGVDSMVWVEPGTPGRPERAFVRSAAVLRAAWYLGGAWRLLSAAWIVPRPLRDAAYDFIARHRHRLPGAADACVVPLPELRARFLDLE
jgi:predicted DCC family thiol-disulfide oxidoreductase YuxK